MNKAELMQRTAQKYPELKYSDIQRIVNTVFDRLSAALAHGDRIELRGFGSFSLKHREARIGRNPRIGEEVAIPEKYLPAFRVGKQLRERINGLPPKILGS